MGRREGRGEGRGEGAGAFESSPKETGPEPDPIEGNEGPRPHLLAHWYSDHKRLGKWGEVEDSASPGRRVTGGGGEDR